ncbi:MAG: IS110 family transposase [Pleomorphochaeta sp.]
MIDRPKELTATRIIGLDLSKKTLVGCTLSRDSGFQKKSFFNEKMNEQGRNNLISQFKVGDAIFMEGGTSSFNLARYLLEHTASNVYVLNPMKLHIIFESICKTDKQDAAKIAKYARDANPENWVLIPIPTKEESADRALIKLHIAYSQLQTKLINKLHAIFTGMGYPDLKKSDLKNPEKRQSCVDELLKEDLAIFSANLLVRNIEVVESQKEQIHNKIIQILINHPKEALAWLSIPGIGDITAATLIAFVGNGERFSKADQLRNYIGLIPRKDQSGSVDKQLSVSHFGCMPVRRHIVQAAWSIKNFNHNCSLTRYWQKLEKRGKFGQKTAVATANKMISIGFALLKNGEIYNMVDEEYFFNKLKRYKLEALI